MQVQTPYALPTSSASEYDRWIRAVHEGLTQRKLSPYLGPEILPAGTGVPTSYRELAEFFGKKVALPRRARGNLWASAQYVESQKLRATAVAYMAEAFAMSNASTPFHAYLASLELPLIVDTWYDDSMRNALSGRDDWAEIQGISRAGIGEDRFYRAYDGEGELSMPAAVEKTTLLYKPHGAKSPAKNFLVSDADYVEVLTEIDIQTPIPEVVKERRAGLGFVMLGCRFHDQMLRNYARQITKRSAGPNYVLVDSTVGVTPNEQRFIENDLGARLVSAPWSRVAQDLMG